MKIKVLLALLVFTNGVSSQIIDNNMQGYYQAKSDSGLYSFFEFDGNGKVSIAGMGSGDYFIKGDTLIVYPDKSIFKFKIANKMLVGASSWVENETWARKDTIVANNRKDDALARKKASLLNEYYKISDSESPFGFLGNDGKSKEKKEKISQLCNQGLSKACLDYFGLLLIDDQGMEALLYPEKNTKPKPLNPQIIALGNKIISQGEPEGYTVLGSYYYLLGKKEKAIQQWNLGVEKGSEKSALALFQLEME